jgi:intracellular septation protein A
MGARKRLFPFNAEQTLNILSEFGPLVTMFVVNAMYGINTGTWALIISTCMAIGAMVYVFGRPPVFPLIASTVTIVFGALTLITGDPKWVQIKVTIFNAMFAGFLFGGLWATSEVLGRRALLTQVGMLALGLAAQIPMLLDGIPNLLKLDHPVATNLICLGTMLIGFLLGGLVFKRNFFGYAFEKTFHYTKEGWDQFTWSFAWFFVFTAVANEFIRLTFKDQQMYDVFGHQMNGVNIWILFKIAFIMPLSGVYAWILTRLMHKHRIPDAEVAASHVQHAPVSGERTVEYATLAADQQAAVVKVRNVGPRTQA